MGNITSTTETYYTEIKQHIKENYLIDTLSSPPPPPPTTQQVYIDDKIILSNIESKLSKKDLLSDEEYNYIVKHITSISKNIKEFIRDHPYHVTNGLIVNIVDANILYFKRVNSHINNNNIWLIQFDQSTMLFILYDLYNYKFDDNYQKLAAWFNTGKDKNLILINNINNIKITYFDDPILSQYKIYCIWNVELIHINTL